MKVFFAVASLALVAAVAAETCTQPKVEATSYTPADAQVLTHIPFIAVFTLTCANGASNVNLYADVAGSIVPVVKTQDGGKYQVSWTKEVKKAKSGDHQVNLYDEEGYAAVRRVLERGEDPASVKPLVTIVVNYPGAYMGPWVNSELLAAGLGFLVFYLAYSSKSALLA